MRKRTGLLRRAKRLPRSVRFLTVPAAHARYGVDRPLPGIAGDGAEDELVKWVTLKLELSPPRADGVAIGWPVELTIVIGSASSWAILTCLPSMTVVAFWNCTLPNWSSVSSRRPAVGASSTHSADDSEEV